ncbi:hypothetical protein HNQ59_001572 [Chitinivorax tropicus]|uniref:Uncharacterized protein n=1 Tax=Chitinivorax tropicus TaxID=714531 RepID=A0A840MGB6_9PROT|nr:hypothetical protein [Chitinivorax tropicus]
MLSPTSFQAHFQHQLIPFRATWAVHCPIWVSIGGENVKIALFERGFLTNLGFLG